MRHEFGVLTQGFLDRAECTFDDRAKIEFSPSRWPWTYAYDFVRAHHAYDMSRSEVAGLLSDYVSGLVPEYQFSTLKSLIASQLARAYCLENDIDVPWDVLDKMMTG